MIPHQELSIYYIKLHVWYIPPSEGAGLDILPNEISRYPSGNSIRVYWKTGKGIKYCNNIRMFIDDIFMVYNVRILIVTILYYCDGVHSDHFY